jgi:hypothetical protein
MNDKIPNYAMKTNEERAADTAANITKHADTIAAIKILQISGRFPNSQLLVMMHSLMGYVTQGELWDVAAHLQIHDSTPNHERRLFLAKEPYAYSNQTPSGRSLVVLCDPDCAFNQNSRLEFTPEDAAILARTLIEGLITRS